MNLRQKLRNVPTLAIGAMILLIIIAAVIAAAVVWFTHPNRGLANALAVFAGMVVVFLVGLFVYHLKSIE